MHPVCLRRRDHTQRSASPFCPRKRPRADAPGARRAMPTRTPRCSSCSGAARGICNGRFALRPSQTSVCTALAAPAPLLSPEFVGRSK
eukprot:3505743-Alexandrium_andersonii.AAC.1